MKWQSIAKYLGYGSVSVLSLFTALFLLTGLDYTFTGDDVCEGLECSSYINVTTSYWRICFAHYNDTKYQNETLFKKVSRSRTLHVNMDKVSNIISTEPYVEVDWLVPARGKGNWRLLKDGDCWDRGKINKIKLDFHPKKAMTFKWSFILEDKVDIDPILISYQILYKQLSRQEPIYNYTIVEVKEFTYKNGTLEKAHNYTERTLTGYNTVYYDGEKIGLKVGNKTYPKDSNVEGNKVYVWNVPQGDRNYEEFGKCRIFEIEKGVCHEKTIA